MYSIGGASHYRQRDTDIGTCERAHRVRLSVTCSGSGEVFLARGTGERTMVHSAWQFNFMDHWASVGHNRHGCARSVPTFGARWGVGYSNICGRSKGGKLERLRIYADACVFYIMMIKENELYQNQLIIPYHF